MNCYMIFAAVGIRWENENVTVEQVGVGDMCMTYSSKDDFFLS